MANLEKKYFKEFYSQKYDKLIFIRNLLLKLAYKGILKRIFFLNDPEKVHDRMIIFGEKLGRYHITKKITSFLFNYKNSLLEQEILGIKFFQPIGLAAGFDKNARLTQILPKVGFGFAEVGSVTGEPCAGNPGRHLWRLPKDKSLLVYYGLKNDGCEVIAESLVKLRFEFPVGVSIAKTNDESTVARGAGIRDYVKAYKIFNDKKIGDYFTINISCPNAFGGQPFHSKESLELLLSAIFKEPKIKPVFIKISPDLSFSELDDIIEVVRNHGVDGIITSNLIKTRRGLNIKDQTKIPSYGGFGGKLVKDKADKQLEYLYNKTKGDLVLIGLGGVSSAEDAYRKIKLGASLVQLITGMIYEGPQVIAEINQGLVKLLKRDGFKSISEAVGADVS